MAKRVIYRQGDVVLEKIDRIPVGATVREVGCEIRIQGETGNDHVMPVDGTELDKEEKK